MNIEQILLVATAAGALAGYLFPLALKHLAPVREAAVVSADYVQAIREAVEFAEAAGIAQKLPGADKFVLAVKKVDDYLDEAGIHGNARNVTLERAKADIELMRARLYPKP